jgi:hypothetical protein
MATKKEQKPAKKATRLQGKKLSKVQTLITIIGR